MRLPSPIKRFVHDPHAIEGLSRPIASGVYRALTATELHAARLLDARLHERSPEDDHVSDVTALIKTFERPRIVRRLVQSMRRLYPDLSVLVVDDSRTPVTLEGARTIAMPYDSGISAGRNEGLRHVETEYVLVLDDDIVLFWGTRLGAAVELMERHPQIDIMGGQLVDLPFLTTRPLAQTAGSVLDGRRPRVPIGTEIAGLRVCEKVPNFFLARTERLALVSWDPQLKLLEHADFFTRALGVLTTVFNPDLKCLHGRTPFDAAYMEKRLDFAAYRELLEARYSGQ
jgi:glycosyltransferase involved in cell wall biosynthesis